MTARGRTITLLFLLTGFIIWAQTTVSGKVNYEYKPLKDINVTLKDIYDGATTDENGSFSFTNRGEGRQNEWRSIIICRQ